jgi:hypothetical protein
LSDFSLSAQVEGIQMENLPVIKSGISIFPQNSPEKAIVYEVFSTLFSLFFKKHS